MGLILFLSAAIIEITFAVYCAVTKTNPEKSRAILRIAVFAAFGVLTLLTLIEWGLRYYALAVWLFLLAIHGSITLLRNKAPHGVVSPVRTLLKAIGMTALFLVFSLPAILFPQHKALETTGSYPVATASYTYTDADRVETYTDSGEKRSLNVKFWYPDNASGTYPLIIFSHGAFGVNTSNETLFNELASHGYVIGSIDHTYHCFFTTHADGTTIWIDSGYMQEVSAENARSDPQGSFALYQKWMGLRMGDINFVIDHILEETQNDQADRVYQLVDKSKIGVMGHSLGGSAALGIGRMREDVRAVIALESPFLYDIQGVENGAFVYTPEKYPLPVLNVYSDGAWNILGDRPQYAENFALLSDTPANAYNIHISGVGHLTLTDFALTSPILTRMLNGHASTTSAVECLTRINQITLNFFDSFLKDKGEFVPDRTD